MKVFGLTGNMGCGKSTVAIILATLPDAVIFDCDLIAKEIIRTGKYADQIKDILGEGVFLNGKLNLLLVANAIFSDSIKKKAFEELIHPLVWREVEERLESGDPSKIYIIESALIYETDSESRFDAVILAACSKEVQMERLTKNRKMLRSDIEARLKDQIPTQEKQEYAQYIIDTDCTLLELETRVRALYEELRTRP